MIVDGEGFSQANCDDLVIILRLRDKQSEERKLTSVAVPKVFRK